MLSAFIEEEKTNRKTAKDPEMTKMGKGRRERFLTQNYYEQTIKPSQTQQFALNS